MTLINEKNFLQELLAAIPEFVPIREEEKEYHEIGIHMVMLDFRVMTEEAIAEKKEDLLKRIVAFVVRTHAESRDEAGNAIFTSFFEHMDAEPLEYFYAHLPAAFAQEVKEYLQAFDDAIARVHAARERGKEWAQLPLPSLFAAFVVQSATNRFSVYLVNNSSVAYESVKMLTGGFASADDDVIQISKLTKEKGGLQPHDVLLLDESDYDELDFVICYELELTDRGGQRRIYQFHLPKYGVGYEKQIREIPVLKQKGMPIVLREREV